MTSSSEFVSDFSLFARLPRHEMDRIAATLRSAKVIPVGGRGLNAVNIGAKGVAILLTCLMGSYRPKDALKVANAFSSLKSTDVPQGFVEYLAELFENPELAQTVAHLEVSRVRPYAKLTFDDGKEIVFDDGEWRAFDVIAKLDGAVFHQLTLKMQPRSRGVWSPPRG